MIQTAAYPYGALLANLARNNDAAPAKAAAKAGASLLGGNPPGVATSKPAPNLLTAPKIENAKAKEYVRARMVEIGKQIQQLKKNLTGDPKFLAHALTGLVRELKQLARMYKDAQGVPMPDVDASMPATSAAADPAKEAAKAEAKDEGEASASEATQDAASQSNATPETPETADTPGSASADPESADQVSANPDAQSAPKAAPTLAEQRAAEIAFWNKQVQPTEADGFIREVKGFLNDIKHMFGLVKFRLEVSEKPKTVEAMVKEHEELLKDLTEDLEKIKDNDPEAAATPGQMLAIAA